ncbi:PaaI family thioesterase [Asticcacaulis sp. EMRT-3]|uniref:PaaI family thioesterase n=1 Tax=Asticcacaulis sp. EMRT-3 TaxID=3040349 RepID=UPI0024AFFC43|nr:PaaI family thioesterase [Asticcacaulis sp. EMRT-3]MDI7774867.1 PaaI family thioesterase [Asticcacaulis sp. EMRT-3]
MTDRQIETVTEGEFAGWSRELKREGFNGLVGAYYYQAEDPANLKVAFKAQKQHLNGGGTVHGGCLLTLADTSLFIFSLPCLDGGSAVTVQLDSQFLSPGHEGDIIVASGEITRAGKSLIYGRGQLTCGERILMTFSGVLARKATRPGGDG